MRSFLCRLALAASSGFLAVGCASRPSAPANAPSHRVTWTVRRASDNAPLANVTSPPVRVGGGELRVRTDSREPSENRPAFPEFRARLSPNRGDRRLTELVTRVFVREEYHTKKGKRKVSRRIIGALLPMRPGETLGVNGPGDPVVVEVRLGSGPSPK